jgi:hypothetical protein
MMGWYSLGSYGSYGQWQALVNMALNLKVPEHVEEFLKS